MQGTGEHPVPVEVGQHLALHEPHAPAFLGGIQGERRRGLLLVVELSHDRLAVARDQGAAAVTVVGSSQRSPVQQGQQVGRHHGCLAPYRRGGFGVGHAAHIAQGKDIGEAHVLEAVLVHLHKAVGCRQGALGHHIGGGHGWGDMQHPVGDHLLTATLTLRYPKDRLLGVGAHLGEHVVVASIDALARHHLPQGSGIGGNPKDAGGGRGVDHLGAKPLALKDVVGQVGNLLGRPWALDGHRRAGEDGVSTTSALAALEGLNRLPGVGGMVAGIVAANAARAQGFRQPLDLVPTELHARRHHQHPVAEGGPRGGGELVGLRLEARHGVADPGHSGRDQVAFGPAGFIEAEHPSPHQGPTGLVIVIG